MGRAAKPELRRDSVEGTPARHSPRMNVQKHGRVGALQNKSGMALKHSCRLTFIPCYYHSLSPGENENALGFKALRQAQHLRVLTFLVLIGWICVLRVTAEIGTTTLESKTSLTGKSLKRLLPGMHITPGN